MTQGIPAGVVVLVLLSLAMSAWIAWTRRDRYASRGVQRWAEMLGDFALVSLMIIMIAAAIIQVTVRFLLSRYLIVEWTEELAILCLVWLSFLSGAMIIRGGGHIAFEALCEALPLGLRRANLALVDLLMVVVLAPIAWYGHENARSLDIMMTVSLGVPLAAFGYAIPVTACMMILVALSALFGHLLAPRVEVLKAGR